MGGPGYELFDHTADLGIRVWAPSLPELVPPATEALYAAIGQLRTLDSAAVCDFDLAGDDPAVLLRDYLAEILLLFERERRRLTDLRVRQFTPQHLAVSGQARPVDLAASVLEREVKAVTYHQLAICRRADGYEATCILDI